MAIKTTYANALVNFDSLLDSVSKDRKTVVISRKGKGDVALIAADELSSLMETVHLLRSPTNAKRLFSAMKRAEESIVRARTLRS